VRSVRAGGAEGRWEHAKWPATRRDFHLTSGARDF
jgi:hypothetical protein